jgi:hypothetical protein
MLHYLHDCPHALPSNRLLACPPARPHTLLLVPACLPARVRARPIVHLRTCLQYQVARVRPHPHVV